MLFGLLTAIADPLQLAWCVGVGVDGDFTIPIQSDVQEIVGWVLSFGPAIDFDCCVVFGTSGKDIVRVKGALLAGSAATSSPLIGDDLAIGAMPEDVHVGVGDRPNKSLGHDV